MPDIFIVTPCASAKAYDIKLKNKKIDLAKAETALQSRFNVIARTPVTLLIAVNEKPMTIYANSIMMKNVSETEAKGYAKIILGQLEKNGALRHE